ncbi:MAG: PcfJ domain-containing protein [Verrucomicrobiales bacterium]
MPTGPGQHRYEFSDGALFIEADGVRMRIVGYPSPQALRRIDPEPPWRPFSPALRLVQPYRTPKKKAGSQMELGIEVPKRLTPAEEKRLAFRRFRFSLPNDIAKSLEKFHSGQWPMLVLLVKYPPARELAAHNPVLAFLLARHFVRGRFGPPRVAEFLKLKQRDMLGALGFPAQKSAVAILRKIHPPALNIAGADSLGAALTDDAVRAALGHLTQISGGVLALVGDPACARWCSPKLLQEVAAERAEVYRPDAANKLQAICRMRETMRARGNPPPLRDLANLRRVHDETLANYRDFVRKTRLKEAGRFPKAPPIPGTAHIVPLTSAAALRDEGEGQDNCVGSYAQRVRQGLVYIYRVTWPERSTLSVVKDETGNWIRSELEISGNRPVSARTAKFVDEWLGRFRLGL